MQKPFLSLFNDAKSLELLTGRLSRLFLARTSIQTMNGNSDFFNNYDPKHTTLLAPSCANPTIFFYLLYCLKAHP